MKVIETLMVRDEMDMLEVHFAELDEIVDRFVLVESPVTHRGDPKPLHLAENWDRFAPWHDRIWRVQAEPEPGIAPWAREHYQRDAASMVIEALADDGDVILISDVDEFPPRDFDYTTVRPVLAFDQKLAMYAADWIYPELHRCSVAATWRYVKANGGLAAVRDRRATYRGVQGGWHLTWLGGLEAQREKLRVTCHTEMTQTEYDRIWNGDCYERGFHHGDGGKMMIPVDVDSTWPEKIFKREVPTSWFRPREEPCA